MNVRRFNLKPINVNTNVAHSTCSLTRRLHQGYTLLEVVLALGLTILIIGGITVAINFHLTTLRDQQEEIERAQVARQSLFLITKDIRAAIPYKPIETTALNELI